MCVAKLRHITLVHNLQVQNKNLCTRQVLELYCGRKIHQKAFLGSSKPTAIVFDRNSCAYSKIAQNNFGSKLSSSEQETMHKSSPEVIF